MRLHLVISRHGLPVTRILWTTSAVSAGEYGAHRPASTAAVASSRTPNIAFSNGGYTVAQLLEDVNEVVPLETEPQVFDEEHSGQWGLEDYVVEVAGSECLHFMEVDGLLRDGDEVVIRALQLADLRTRRLCGRHQITAEGKHLIDGVAFGSPFLKRTTSTRPAITIPPRKKRRTVFSGWERGPDFTAEDALDAPVDEEGDGDWMPPPETGFGKELSIMPAEHEESMGTVIRHPIDHLESESEDVSEIEEDENELESELQALKEDFEEPSQFVDIRNQTRNASGHPLRATSIAKRPTSKGSLAAASSLSSKRSRADDSSPRTSKAVRFNKGDEGVPELQAEENVAQPSHSDSSDSSVSSDSDSDSDSDAASSSEVEPAQEAVASDSDSSSASSDSSDSSDSESEDEVPPAPKAQPPAVISAPGEGSVRTKKSNNRLKLRRRLSKLKELGALPDEADFDALRAWEDKNDGWFNPEQSINWEAPVQPEPPKESSEKSAKQQKKDKKEQEQNEFEARRQKLLRDLASGNGVDVDETSEKENRPPRTAAAEAPAKQVPDEDQPEKESSKEASHRRTLDVASSRRMLFGSLGMRTPKTKEDEEETRRKLAAKASASGRQKRPSQVAQEDADKMDEAEDESDGDADWMNKLIIRAVECVYPEIELTAPPYPFVQRWDKEANALIREKKGPGKKRKRKQRIQVYHNEEEFDENGDWYGDDYYQGDDQGYYEAANDSYYQGHYAGEAEDDGQLNYDEGPEPEPTANANDDLPLAPGDMGSVPDLSESEVKVGAIIAFRQLDMSKATNWQPQMSEYRVAEVRSVKEQGVINVLLAKRDRKPPSANEDDELRQFSKFEVPDLANEEQEDDGYRELTFAELSDPKLLQPASGDQNIEGSIVSVVEESVPNAQSAPEMDLDETTFVTLENEISHLDSPRESPGIPDEVQKTPGPAAVPQIQVQIESAQRSVTPPIPSPSFTGFHSARSWQQVTPGLNQEGNLEGHTLVGGETPSVVMNRDEGPSMLSYASANQSFDDTEETTEQHDRQVVESLAPPESNESGPQSGSLLSTIGGYGTSSSQPVKKESKKEKRNTAPTSSSRSESWTDLLSRLRNGQSDPDQLLMTSDDGAPEMSPEPEDNIVDNPPLGSAEDGDSVSGDSHSPSSNSPSPSPKPPTSAQKDPSTEDPNRLVNFFSPAASTRSKQSQRARESIDQTPGSQIPASQIPASQTSAVIDLTSSPVESPEPEHTSTPSRRAKSALFGTDKSSPRSGPGRASTGRIQRMVEVSISPSQSQKKRRTSRKF